MKNDKGITLIALSVMIIVLLILASITIYYGKESIDKANLESLKTNMLLIRTKTKEYVEQANFKAGTSGNIYDESGNLKEEVREALKGEQILNPVDYAQYVGTLEEGQLLYNVNGELKNMGLKDIDIDQAQDEKYLVKYDIKNAKVEIYNTKGFEVNGNKVYDLTTLQS